MGEIRQIARNKQYLEQIIGRFPPIQHAIGYGSGLFFQPKSLQETLSQNQQTPYQSQIEKNMYQVQQDKFYKQYNHKNMIDLLFAVEDPISWHEQNIKVNGADYSWMKKLGPKWIEYLSNNVGVGVYYNAYVQHKDQMLKYGVVQAKTLINDLKDWDRMFLAGRLQKPHIVIQQSSQVSQAQSQNLKSALATSLLLLPEKFSYEELFKTICGMSYNGDIRMDMNAENTFKIQRIVQGSYPDLLQLYMQQIKQLPKDNIEIYLLNDKHMERDYSQQAQYNLLRKLPRTIFLNLVPLCSRYSISQASLTQDVKDDASWRISQKWKYTSQLKQVLKDIVRFSSIRQAALGLFSTGFNKSIRYVTSKFNKFKQN